ncbi:hypothetical protein CROQUDRAFT_137172 [Cronartium quercuum f. sp. fusiforme G11]|uniref:Uncharacterized protein n=1 Tax=Cronartium quercuum f. sp. fusiforme G11 TaxID=708437 RepID=A0A9P6N8U3_9BASI|nr:hypothetical protein CROQUDRAFT_137172 [Cronartium quercuum f. sp. fusiforme G11]
MYKRIAPFTYHIYHTWLHNLEQDADKVLRVKKQNTPSQSSNDLPLGHKHDFQTPENNFNVELSSTEVLLREKVKDGLKELHDELTLDKSGLKKKFDNFPPQKFAAYTAIRGKYLITKNLSLFEDKYKILETSKNILQGVLEEFFPSYNPKQDISEAGWIVDHVIFPGFIDQINWIYEFLNKQGIKGEGIGTKDEFFKLGSTYFVELMKQWFSEYEAILEEACYCRLWHDLYKCRTEFHAENVEIAPGFIIHHLEFGHFVNCLASLTLTFVSKWFHQHSAKWENVLYPFTLPESRHGRSFKVVYNVQTRTNIEGSGQTYFISSLQEKYGWPYTFHAKRKFLNTEPHRQREANIQSTNEKASA